MRKNNLRTFEHMKGSSSYLLVGFIYLIGRQEQLMVTLGPRLGQGSRRRSAATLGFLFGLNVPACLRLAVVNRCAGCEHGHSQR